MSGAIPALPEYAFMAWLRNCIFHAWNCGKDAVVTADPSFGLSPTVEPRPTCTGFSPI